MNTIDTDIQDVQALNVECSKAVRVFAKNAYSAFKQCKGVIRVPDEDNPQYKEEAITVDLGSLGTCTLITANQPKSRDDFQLSRIILDTAIDETHFSITVPIGGSPSTVNVDTAEEIKDEDGFPEYAKMRLIQCAAALKEVLNPQAVRNLVTEYHDDATRVLDAE